MQTFRSCFPFEQAIDLIPQSPMRLFVFGME